MASVFDGLFTSPEDIKKQRVADITKQRTALSQMGGSMNQLLGQVAGQGLLTGRAIGESIGDIAGLSSKSENKAAELQAMMQSINPNNPDDLANMAKMLNELGYTREAVALLEQRKNILDTQYSETRLQGEKDKAQRGFTRTINKIIEKPLKDSKGNIIGTYPATISVTQQWNAQKKEWEDISGKTGEGADAPYGGITVIDPKTGMVTMKQGNPAVDGNTEDLTISP